MSAVIAYIAGSVPCVSCPACAGLGIDPLYIGCGAATDCSKCRGVGEIALSRVYDADLYSYSGHPSMPAEFVARGAVAWVCDGYGDVVPGSVEDLADGFKLVAMVVVPSGIAKDGAPPMPPKPPMASCSQCGRDLGHGKAGVSHCSDHRILNRFSKAPS